MVKVIAFDFDSTIADTEHRRHMINTTNRADTDWLAYGKSCLDDGDGPAMDFARMVQDQPGLDWIIVTRRDDGARAESEKWLSNKNLYPLDMFMLKDQFSSDIRTQPEWKVAAVRDYEARTGHKVVLFVDDNPKVIEAMRIAGIPALLVDPGYESEYTVGL